MAPVYMQWPLDSKGDIIYTVSPTYRQTPHGHSSDSVRKLEAQSVWPHCKLVSCVNKIKSLCWFWSLSWAKLYLDASSRVVAPSFHVRKIVHHN